MKIEELMFVERFFPKDTKWNLVSSTSMDGVPGTAGTVYQFKHNEKILTMLLSSSKKGSKSCKVLFIQWRVPAQSYIDISSAFFLRKDFDCLVEKMKSSDGPTFWVNSRNKMFIKSQRKISKSST